MQIATCSSSRAWTQFRKIGGDFALLALLGIPFVGIRLDESMGNSPSGLTLHFATQSYLWLLAGVALALLGKNLPIPWRRLSLRLPKPRAPTQRWARFFPALAIAAAVFFPLSAIANRYVIELGTVVLTYLMLASGLTIVTGLAGLLDLGYVAFYAIGAYAYALLSLHFGIGFWTALPIIAAVAAGIGVCIGFPALRLRGDYFAVSTLGFAEILRIVITNWSNLTGGPNGLDNIPRLALGGFSFERVPPIGQTSWSQFWGINYSPETRVIASYYIALIFAIAIVGFVMLLRRSPLGRSWEALREDDIAAAAIGIDRTAAKLSAYAIAAAIGGIAGAFFAARQSFISPESFTFIESATILAIIVLGGLGNLFGAALAALIIIGLPELFREFTQYRMLAFGLGMVVLMQARPGGIFQGRRPQILLSAQPEPPPQNGAGA